MNSIGMFRAILRRWWIPVLIAMVAVVAVLAITPNAKAAQVEYTAKTILVANATSSSGQGINFQEAALQTTVGAVPALAAKELHYVGNPAVLAAQVTATVDANVGTLDIQVTDVNGQRAAAVANGFASALNATLLQQSVTNYQSQVTAVQNRLNDLQAQIEQYRNATDPIGTAKLGSAEDQYRLAYDQFQQLAAQGQPVAPLTVLQKAVPVASTTNSPPTSKTTRSAIGGGVGLIIGAALAILIDMIWPRINDREDAEREFGTVVLAEVPKLSRRDRRNEGKHAGRSAREGRLASFREAYRMLRTSILLIGSSDSVSEGASQGQDMLVAGPQVILVSSPLPREGKSTTVASLAASMAETGRTVLVCNADFRAPQVHKAFGLEPGPGLSDLLSGRQGVRSLADLVHRTSVPGVSFVHSGSQVDDAAELIARRGAELLEEARTLADVVLLDTAPLLVVSDASELLPAVDAVVMVARVGQTTRDSARRSYELLDRAGIPVLGVVLVGAKSPMSYYYGGRYGNSHGSRWKIWLDRRRRGRGVVTVASPSGRRETSQSGGAPTARRGPAAPADNGMSQVINGGRGDAARLEDTAPSTLANGRRGGTPAQQEPTPAGPRPRPPVGQ